MRPRLPVPAGRRFRSPGGQHHDNRPAPGLQAQGCPGGSERSDPPSGRCLVCRGTGLSFPDPHPCVGGASGRVPRPPHRGHRVSATVRSPQMPRPSGTAPRRMPCLMTRQAGQRLAPDRHPAREAPAADPRDGPEQRRFPAPFAPRMTTITPRASRRAPSDKATRLPWAADRPELFGTGLPATGRDRHGVGQHRRRGALRCRGARGLDDATNARAVDRVQPMHHRHDHHARGPQRNEPHHPPGQPGRVEPGERFVRQRHGRRSRPAGHVR